MQKSGEVAIELEDYHANLALSKFASKINCIQSLSETLQENVTSALGSDFLAVQNLKVQVFEMYRKMSKLNEEVHESAEQISAHFEQVMEPTLSIQHTHEDRMKTMEERIRRLTVEVQYLSQRMAVMESKVSTSAALSELTAEIRRLNTRVSDAMSIYPGRSAAHSGFDQAQYFRSRTPGLGHMPLHDEDIPTQSNTIDSDSPAIWQNSYSHSRSPSPPTINNVTELGVRRLPSGIPKSPRRLVSGSANSRAELRSAGASKSRGVKGFLRNWNIKGPSAGTVTVEKDGASSSPLQIFRTLETNETGSKVDQISAEEGAEQL